MKSNLGKDSVVWESELNKLLKNYNQELDNILKKTKNVFNYNLDKTIISTEFTQNNTLNMSSISYAYLDLLTNKDENLINFIFNAMISGSSRSYNANTNYEINFLDSTNELNFNEEKILLGEVQFLNSSYVPTHTCNAIVTIKNNKIHFDIKPKIALSSIYYISFRINNIVTNIK